MVQSPGVLWEGTPGKNSKQKPTLHIKKQLLHQAHLLLRDRALLADASPSSFSPQSPEATPHLRGWWEDVAPVATAPGNSNCPRQVTPKARHPHSLLPCPRGQLGPVPGAAENRDPRGGMSSSPPHSVGGAPQRAGQARPHEQQPGEDINQPPDHISCSERSCKTREKIDLSGGQMGAGSGLQPRARLPSTLGVPPAPGAPHTSLPARGWALVAWAAPSGSQSREGGEGPPGRPGGLAPHPSTPGRTRPSCPGQSGCKTDGDQRWCQQTARVPFKNVISFSFPPPSTP